MATLQCYRMGFSTWYTVQNNGFYPDLTAKDIEHLFEHEMDKLDRELARRDITKKQYEQDATALAKWASEHVSK